MKTDTPIAHLQYFLQDELYLLKTDRDAYRNPVTLSPVMDEQVTVTQQTPVTIFKYLGGNQKNFLVLCHYADAEFMAEAHLTALMNTITRINYSRQDIAIVNIYNNSGATWQELNTYFDPERLLILGDKALPSSFPTLQQNEVQQINNSQALYTFSFSEMMGNKDNTKLFWNQIKTF